MGKDLKIASFKELWKKEREELPSTTADEEVRAYGWFLKGWTKSSEHYND